MRVRLLSAVLVLGVCCVASAWGQTPVVQKVATPPALTPLTMSVGGRVMKEGADDYVSQWPGSHFEASFQGGEVYFRVGIAHEILHVMIDGRTAAPLVDPEAGVYRVAGLGDAKHTVGVFVVTESQSNTNRFGGFGIPAGEKAFMPERRARQMEFIGDSHTVGYGNTSAKLECKQDEVWATTDNSEAFGALTAEHYHAEYQVNAISGHGVVRNYGGFAGDPVPEAYPYTLFDKKQRYSDATWRPQVIVISLGTNDFSTPLHAGEKWATREELHSDYEATYVRFIESLRARNPNATIILWATEMANGEIEAEVKKVLERAEDRGVKKLIYLPIEHLAFSGCHSHPSLADDRTIRDRLVEAIDKVTGVWERR